MQIDSMNLLMLILLGASLLLLLNIFKKQREVKKLFRSGTIKVEKEADLFRLEFTYFKSLRNKINLYFHFKKKKHLANYLYFAILIIELAMFLGFLFSNKIIFAISFPIIFHVFMLKAMELVTVSIHNYIEKELPIVIKHLIKVMSKTSDLKTVMYETSKNLNEPLRSMFFDLSRKMITENHEKALMELADETDNIWMYAFSFLLISYKEQSKKEDIVKNLTTLADMLIKENDLKEKAITDKKFVTIMNYALALIGLAGFVANIIFNPSAKSFFFENVMGMFCLIIGVCSILGTIVINLMMTNKAQ